VASPFWFSVVLRTLSGPCRGWSYLEDFALDAQLVPRSRGQRPPVMAVCGDATEINNARPSGASLRVCSRISRVAGMGTAVRSAPKISAKRVGVGLTDVV